MLILCCWRSGGGSGRRTDEEYDVELHWYNVVSFLRAALWIGGGGGCNPNGIFMHRHLYAQ